MSGRRVLGLGIVVLVIGILGADVPAPKPAGGLDGAMTVYRDAATFDPAGRHFLLWNNPVMITQIHQQLVTEFISRPGAGISRLPPPPPVPQEWVELIPDSLGDGFAPNSKETRRPPRYDAARKVLTFPEGSKRAVHEQIWLLREQRLMSVNAKPGPAVYVQDARADHDRMKTKPVAASKNTPTRKLDDFETGALAHLRGGDDVALQSSAREMRVLGAIRARQQCLECHTAKTEELLGAFSYRLTLKSGRE